MQSKTWLQGRIEFLSSHQNVIKLDFNSNNEMMYKNRIRTFTYFSAFVKKKRAKRAMGIFIVPNNWN